MFWVKLVDIGQTPKTLIFPRICRVEDALKAIKKKNINFPNVHHPHPLLPLHLPQATPAAGRWGRDRSRRGQASTFGGWVEGASTTAAALDHCCVFVIRIV